MNTHDHDTAYVAEAMPAFISEAHEQVAAMEQLLLQLESAPEDRDMLDALFRCAHTVKGSAGIFGLDEIVGFTHQVEALLESMRDGVLAPTSELLTLLLQCSDQIRLLVGCAGTGRAETSGASKRAELVSRIEALISPGTPAASAPTRQEAGGSAPARQRWQVRASFGRDLLRNGMDPLAILNYVATLGVLTLVSCDETTVPELEALDPEQCHLEVAFVVETERGRDAIEDAFAFVREETLLEVIPADSDPQHRGEPPVAAPAAPTRAASSQDAAAAPPSPGAQEPPGLPGAAAGPGAGAAARERESGQAAIRHIKVQADRLDAVINLLGELVIASAGATLLARQSQHGPLVEANEQIGRLVEDIRNGTLQLRMVPIGETFSRFRRVVRDTAGMLGKDVALEMIGGETELDKSVVERIADPLMHLVRNALDHGLETPAQRLAAGKAPQGRLTLSACHESGSIVIRIADDGRGIQRRRVLERAWDRGLVERGVVPPDEQILELIFAPGFSTAEQVTNLSGRGVGMDVVRSNIEALRGTVRIDSTEGLGTTIEIRLPLTLAIIDGFLVGVGGSRFIFPLESVVEVIESPPAGPTHDQRGRSMIELRGRALPVLSLRRLYGLDSAQPPRSSVVVIHADGHRFGVTVDSLLGQHQTVIKPLGLLFRSLRGISGSTILGSGEVALIFDVASLGQLAAEQAPAARLTRAAGAGAYSTA